MTRNYRTIYLIFSLLLYVQATAQPYTLEVSIKNQPDSPVVIGAVRGEKFLPVDTLDIREVTGGYSRNVSHNFRTNHLCPRDGRIAAAT